LAISSTRDPEAVCRGLEAWLAARRPRGTVPSVGGLQQPSAGGLSSETYLFDAGRPLVARLPPAGDALFPVYDLHAQARVMQCLARHGGVPVPEVVAYEADESFLGTPFLVMARVQGRVPSDNPPYLATGFVVDATPAQQRRLHESFVDTCARITAIDWQAAELGFLARPGGTTLDAEIAWWAGYFDWAADGARIPVLEDALAWCREHRPATEPAPSLLWGDVRIPNVVFDDAFAPVAVLDWEMASIGPAEVDLGWFLTMHSMTEEYTRPLPGFLAGDDVVARFAAGLGRPVEDLAWYEAWAAFRSAAIMARMATLLHGLGLSADLRLREHNPSAARLRALLDGEK
jgi:aminoglycoside phosphotransferase (APT) family kinase protein